MAKDHDAGIPVIPRLLTIGLMVFIAYIYFTDFKRAKEEAQNSPAAQTGTVKYLLTEEDVKEIEFIDGKTTISMDKEKAEQLSKHLDEAFEQDVEVFEIELDKYEPGNPAPEEQ